MLKNIFCLHPDELKKSMESLPGYRSKQLLHWLYDKHVFDPQLMSNLPAETRDELSDKLSFFLPQIDLKKTAKDGTTKYRLKLEDESIIEMVLIPDDKKNTLCVSSQVGCTRACNFCATGELGLKRNLQTHEIVAQIMLGSSFCQPNRLTNLVFMGMGEPMDNLDNVLKALSIIQADDTLSFSPRRTTISTCGITDGIIHLADSKIKTKLAVSLNSAIDEKRSKIMPVNEIYPLKELKQALKYYLTKSNFRVTFEYILIPGFNMGDDDISALRSFAGDLSCKLNFIPYNTVPSLPYRSPSEAEIETFLKKAHSLNQAVTLRRSRGAEIFGACGQLAGQR
ncbi:MAG: 23S rRNA (adenine(2503)-C(2))-methyltransferase RlmN [Candidatus Cloacimonetes bacterium]|jgi:23S rRNA (adenine2503-C2)-methyltransferase|nr:23S rRNA (adenine(2503)-C(2))-methyltransferase RlmN [Candidatus Cloacimonadota bacterium]